MMLNSTLPRTPLYDPKSKIQKFRFDEDINNIRLNVLGTSGLYSDPHFWFYLDDTKEWKRPKEICSRPLFIHRSRPDRFDALQGQLGDCWLISAMEALTTNEHLIKHVVPRDQSFDHNYTGAFHFRIWQLGMWYDVVVDDRLPVYKNNNKLCFAHSRGGDIFWAALLEKAYAKMSSVTAPSYENLHGGLNMTGLQDLSGGIVEKEDFQTPLSFGSPLKWYLNEVFLKYALLSCECHIILDKSTGLVDRHGYAITSLYKCSDDDPDYPGLFLVRIMNPWGTKEWKRDWSDDDYNNWRQIDREIKRKLDFVSRDDGEFWIDEENIVKYFAAFSISYLGPGQYLTSRLGDVLTTWRTTNFSGEWINNISSGGSEIKTRHKNPQYRIQLDYPENDSNRDGLCQVIIELVQRSKEGRRIVPKIAFYIYSLKKITNPPMPLDKRFFENNDPLDKHPDFSKSNGRAYLTSMNLEPGKYCIVPCTEKPNNETQFVLRVLSESRVELWEYDTEISKSLLMEEQSPNESDKGHYRLFYDVSKGQKEIDWIELKEILEVVMNPTRSYIWIVLKCIQGVFEKYVSAQSSNNYETGNVVFAKDECRSMIAMLDDNHSGKLGFSEFNNLWNKICFWTRVYEQHRDETEGYVKIAQLRDALSSMGYDVNKRTVHSISYIYANDDKNITLTDFILCGVALESVLALYDKEDVEDGNKITFSLAEWVKNTLIL